MSKLKWSTMPPLDRLSVMVGQCVAAVDYDDVAGPGPVWLIRLCADNRIIAICAGCRHVDVRQILADAGLRRPQHVDRLFRALKAAAAPPKVCECTG